MNARRTALSAIKGGKLAMRAGRSMTFAISDVHAPIEDDPAVIGSGPTVLTDDGAEGVSPGVVTTTFVLAGSRRDAMAGAAAEGERRGYRIHRLGPPTLGAAREAAETLVAQFTTVVGVTSGASPTGPDARIAMISSGETTVALPSDNRGRGGRNQEFALAAALSLGTPAGLRYGLASIGTDGIDGPTDAAGAIADSSTLERATAAGLDPVAALASHDSYPFFQRLGDLVVTGPTGTNVGDLQIFVGSIISV